MTPFKHIVKILDFALLSTLIGVAYDFDVNGLSCLFFQKFQSVGKSVAYKT